MDSQKLITWFATQGRTLPWRNLGDPYAIWLAEVILQQTRVAQGWPYFERFIHQFPTIQELASAPQDTVMKAWEGLGYYSRARNLQAAAIQIVENYGGIIPDTVEILLELPGIGPYTARAVASFAYRKPEAVLDGNVFRVLSRLYADPTAIDLPGSRGHFQALADAALGRLPDPAGQSSDFNNAIMDLGATVCTPRAPRCSDCPLQEDCAAYHLQRVQDFPVKAKTKTRRDRYYIYYIIRNYNGQWLMRQRNDASFWKQLWVPPMLETDTQPDGFAHPQHLVGRLVHEFTHFRMHCFLVEVQTLDFKLPPKDFDAQPEKWLHPDDLTELALPTAIHKLLELWRLPRQTDLF